MGDATVQKVIRRILAERGTEAEVALLDLVSACRDAGISETGKIVDSLLPLIYEGTIEFTRNRNLRLRDARETEALLAATV